MLRVLLADDEKLARKRLTRLLGAMPDVELVGACDSGQALLERLRETQADVLLLDIEMAGLTGLETSALLPQTRQRPHVIFVTAHPEHALAAFDLGAVDYVVKPVEARRLRQAIERIRSRLDRDTGQRRLPLPTTSGVLLIDSREISHAAYDGCLVTLQLAQRTVVTDLTLAELEKRLPCSFVRVHRRHIVNLDLVERLVAEDGGGYTAITQHGGRVPVSRQAARNLRKQLGVG